MKKVLICSVPSWNKKSGSDTFSSLIEGYGADNVANIYIRETLPDSEVCNNYFRISENLVLKSVLKRWIKTGQRVTRDSGSDENNKNVIASAQRYKKYSLKRNYLLLFAREIAWKLGVWKTKELDRFLDEFKPDVVFFAMEGYIHFNRICRYILKRTGAKGVGYFWDDNFTYKQSKKLGHSVYRYFQRRDLKKTAKLCSDFFAIAPKTKREADAFFGIDCQLLTKPVRILEPFNEYSLNTPLKMVYTGKLIIGRLDTVKIIGKALDLINADSVKVELDVYTTTFIDKNTIDNLSPHIHILGAIPQTEVPRVQREADILLFAEAVDGEAAKISRLSFSTKLTDYFASGKCIFAVGNEDTAPMEYLKNEDAAIVAYNKDEVVKGLTELICNPDLINRYAKKAYECGIRNHSEQNIKEKLFKILNS